MIEIPVAAFVVLLVSVAFLGATLNSIRGMIADDRKDKRKRKADEIDLKNQELNRRLDQILDELRSKDIRRG